jgi:NTE family protein
LGARISSEILKVKSVCGWRAKHVPEAARESEAVQDLVEYGCLTQMHVVHLLAPPHENDNHTKDVDFTPSGIRRRWEAGYEDMRQALERKPWEGEFDALEGVVLHEQVSELLAD